jgi:hypothetical protein
MPAKRSAAKSRAKKPAKAKPRADRWRVRATYTGEKQFRRGERVWVGFLFKGGERVECIGPSQRKPGTTTIQRVKVEELADLRLEFHPNGFKRADMESDLLDLLKAAELAKKSKT